MNSVFNDFQPDYGTEEENTELIEQVEARQAAEIAEEAAMRQQAEAVAGEASTEAPAPQQQQPQQPQQTEQPEPEEEDKGWLQNQMDSLTENQLEFDAESNTLSGGNSRQTAVHGVLNTAVGLINMIPGVEIPRLPKYADELQQATSEVSGVILPMVFGVPAVVKGAKGLTAGSKILQGATAGRIGTLAAGSGIGAAVDYASDAGEGDNLTGSLKQNFPKTWGWLPDDIATMAHESPDVKRKKNAVEGVFLGGVFDSLGIMGKYMFGKKNLDNVLKWIPENEKAKTVVAELNANTVVEDLDVLAKPTKQSVDLENLGQYNAAKSVDLDAQPVFGYHDLYDDFESGIRSVDDGGIYSASVDNLMILRNIDTVDGRIGSIMREGQLKATLDGIDNPNTYSNLLKGLGEQLQAGGKFGFHTASGRYLANKEIVEAGDELAAKLLDMDVDQMRSFLKPFSGKDIDTGVSVINVEGLAGIHKAIKGYTDEYANLTTERASALLQTSLAGQASDMAESSRLMAGSSAVERAQEQILDRLEFLMTVNGQSRYTRGRALNMVNFWNRLTRTGSEANQAAYTKRIAEGIKNEKNGTLKALQRIAVESKTTMDTLRAISKEKPDMLAPFMMAYEFTDGNINTISRLNQYVKDSTNLFRKMLIDTNPATQSVVLQGMWANIYNSMLSALMTPIKAVVGGTGVLVAKPLSILVGAATTPGARKAVLQRAAFMYDGALQTLGSSLQYGGETFKRASRNTDEIPFYQRRDFQQKNARQLEIVNAVADAAAAEGNFGARAMMDQTNAMHAMADNPMLKFGINAMSGWDGFINSVQANWAARAKIYDENIMAGQSLSRKRIEAMQRKLTREMFDENGKISDEAVKLASKELNMNMDSEFVKSMNGMLNTFPGLKPFLMFPSTSSSMLSYAGTHAPLQDFIGDLNKFRKPFGELSQSEAESLLASKGYPFDKNAEAVYEHLRAEFKGRQGIGTVAVFGAAGLFTADRLRGDGHFDKETQRTRVTNNWKPRTVKGLDGKWYSYSEMGAVGDWLALTANVMDNFDVFRTGKGGTLNDVEFSTILYKMGHVLGASVTNKSVLSGLEPLFDMTSGNSAALSRWAASFGNSLIPLSGQRSELSRLLSPAVRETQQELDDLIMSRNPLLRSLLPEKIDFVDGVPQGEPENFFQRIWNTYSPLKQYGELSEERQFLVDIEFDAMPTLKTNGKGVEYTDQQISELSAEMGKRGYFKEAIREIMESEAGQGFRQAYREAQAQGMPVDVSKFKLIHSRLKTALRSAQLVAQEQLDDAAEIKRIQYYNKAYAIAEKNGDLGEMERINATLQMYR